MSGRARLPGGEPRKAMVADAGAGAWLGSRLGLLALALAAALMWSGLPSRAADEPVATTPIPPPPRDQPAVVPLHSPPPVAVPTKSAPRTAGKPESAASPRERKRTEPHRKKTATRADSRAGKSTKQSHTETGRRAELGKPRTAGPEARPARREAAASHDQLRPPPEYPPHRYYYREEIEGPPFPPPWPYRGPPFAAMPYPRGPMPPW